MVALAVERQVRQVESEVWDAWNRRTAQLGTVVAVVLLNRQQCLELLEHGDVPLWQSLPRLAQPLNVDRLQRAHDSHQRVVIVQFMTLFRNFDPVLQQLLSCLGRHLRH